MIFFLFDKKSLTLVTQIPVRTKLSVKNSPMESMIVIALSEQVANTVKVKDASYVFLMICWQRSSCKAK